MRRESINAAGGDAGRALANTRGWLRRVMPRVAVAAFLLFAVRLLVGGTGFMQTTVGGLFRVVTYLVVGWTVAYYGFKVLRAGKRKLLWRVRRRLVITYLFVGLTPVVLLTLLGLLLAVVGSSQAMARIVAVQVGTTERQALEGARTLATEFLNLPPNTTDRAVQAWVDERAALLGASLPGARVAVWRGAEADAAALGLNEPARWRNAPGDESTRGVGEDAGGADAPLPRWTEGRGEWSGVAFFPPPAESKSAFGSPSVRALARLGAQGRAACVLVTVPVSRGLVGQYREQTGINVRPFFIGVSADRVQRRNGRVEYGAEGASTGPGARGGERPLLVVNEGGQAKEVDFRRDQFGEPMTSTLVNFGYPVFLAATNWASGAQAARLAFMVDWSWAEGGRQVWGDAVMGRELRRSLYVLAGAFLVLELLALFSAAWMTRAVTGTVHKLSRATEFIKRGDFSHRIRVRSRDQLGELAVAFNEMSANVESLLADRVERERLEREIEIAHDVQAQLFPRTVPPLADAEITGECRAARGVAGDYYDYIEVSPGLVAFALGDVSGKGISASLVMSNLQASLRAQVTIIAERLKAAEQQRAASPAVAGATAAGAAGAGAGGDSAAEMPRAVGVAGGDACSPCAVSDMAASINGQVYRSTDTNRFATLFLALYDDRARVLRYTNAGHNAAILARRDGRVERLSAGGMMVGAFDWAAYEEAQVALGAGDALLVFSDGLSEAQNAVGEEYGEERLAGFVAANRAESADELCRLIFEDVDRWTGAAERGDDQTVVILKAREQ